MVPTSAVLSRIFPVLKEGRREEKGGRKEGERKEWREGEMEGKKKKGGRKEWTEG
jgi:hypothetical protein